MKILKVAPLTPTESLQQQRLELELGQLGTALESKKREVIAFMDSLKKKHDPNYEKNSKSQIAKYTATITDSFVVITLD